MREAGRLNHWYRRKSCVQPDTIVSGARGSRELITKHDVRLEQLARSAGGDRLAP